MHTEDLIYKEKQFIRRLAETQDGVFQKLSESLDLTEEGDDWLWDYVFNCQDEVEFEEYLAGYGIEYKSLVGDEEAIAVTFEEIEKEYAQKIATYLINNDQ